MCWPIWLIVIVFMISWVSVLGTCDQGTRILYTTGSKMLDNQEQNLESPTGAGSLIDIGKELGQYLLSLDVMVKCPENRQKKFLFLPKQAISLAGNLTAIVNWKKSVDFSEKIYISD